MDSLNGLDIDDMSEEDIIALMDIIARRIDSGKLTGVHLRQAQDDLVDLECHIAHVMFDND